MMIPPTATHDDTLCALHAAFVRCGQCSKVFKKAPNQTQRSDRHYCSKACYNIARRPTLVTRECARCGKVFTSRLWPSHADVPPTFCSRACVRAGFGDRVKLHGLYAGRSKGLGRRCYRDNIQERVSRAVKSGLLVKPSACSRCRGGTGRIHAHHDNYSRPLEVRWLCTRCHVTVHWELRRAHQSPAA